MVSAELLEKKLSFERIYNYGCLDDVRDYLNNNPELSGFLIETYKKILKEYRGAHDGYYVPVQSKLMFLEIEND